MSSKLFLFNNFDSEFCKHIFKKKKKKTSKSRTYNDAVTFVLVSLDVAMRYSEHVLRADAHFTCGRGRSQRNPFGKIALSNQNNERLPKTL